MGRLSTGARRAFCAALTLTLLSGCTEPEPPAPPPIEIAVVEAVQRDADVTLDMVGQTRGSKDIPIRARVQGFLEGIHFEEGRPVKRGQLLYTIDPDPFQAKVVEAQGYVAEARTRLAKAKSDLDRIRPLAEMKAVSEQDLDGAVAQHEASIGSLQAAEAQLRQAEIELSYTRIMSPIDGSIGLTEAKVGEFVGAEPNPVVLNYVSLNDPIRVRFSINERDYLRFAREFADLRERQEQRVDDEFGDDDAPDGDNDLQLILADGTLHPHLGRVVAYSAAIDPTTGTFPLEADFPNPRGIVLAGQFARIRGVIERREGVVMVPVRAVSELQGIFRLFVVGDDNTVQLRTVELGPQIDNMRIIESGVEAGERVAIEGLLRLRDGAPIAPKTVSLESLKPNAAQGEAS